LKTAVSDFLSFSRIFWWNDKIEGCNFVDYECRKMCEGSDLFKIEILLFYTLQRNSSIDKLQLSVQLVTDYQCMFKHESAIDANVQL